MTVTFDAVTEDVQAADPQTFSHNPVGTPRAVVILAAHNTISTDIIDGPVTYGGAALTRIASNVDAAGEPGRAYAYFLGSSIPTDDPATVSIGRNQSTQSMVAYCVTFTAAADTEVIDFDGIDGGDPANPSVTLNFGGRSAVSVGIEHSGINLPSNITENGDMTRLGDHDYGNQVVVASRLTTAQTSDHAFGYTSSAEDVALTALAIAEVATGISFDVGLIPIGF